MADIVVRPVNGLPVPGRTEFVEELEVLAGGCAANTAAVLAKLGVPTRLAALIGQDRLGQAALADLKTAGVQLDTVWREPTLATSAVIVLVSGSGQRSFLYRDGGNEQLANRHIPDVALREARLVHVGGAMKLMQLDLASLLQRAKGFGCITSLDTDWDARGNWMRQLERALPHVDYLLTNQEEAARLSGFEAPSQAGRALIAYGPQAVVVKRGENGALLTTRSESVDYPAYEVPVRDTTCAGDSFVAGFLLGVSRDWPLEKSMRLANAVGGLCTTQLSHRGIISFEETCRWLENQTPPLAPAQSL